MYFILGFVLGFITECVINHKFYLDISINKDGFEDDEDEHKEK